MGPMILFSAVKVWLSEKGLETDRKKSLGK